MKKLSARQIEKLAMWDLHQAATAAQIQALGLRCFQLGDNGDAAIVSIAAKLPAPAIVVNMCFDLSAGLTDPATNADFTRRLDTTVGSYQELGVQRYFLQFPAAQDNPTVAAQMSARSLQPARGWQEFQRDATPVPEPSRSLAAGCDIKEIDNTYAADFGRIAGAGFDLVVPGQDPSIGVAAEGWLGQLVGRPQWHVFMAFDQGRPAGVGALFIQDNCGWLTFGSTWPDFRGKGLQSALLRARIEKGIALGCHSFYTCTGVAVPGDPQHSYNNILKTGFQPSLVMANYQPMRSINE